VSRPVGNFFTFFLPVIHIGSRYGKIASKMRMGAGLTFGRCEVVIVISVHIVASCVTAPRILASECGRCGGTTDKK